MLSTVGPGERELRLQSESYVLRCMILSVVSEASLRPAGSQGSRRRMDQAFELYIIIIILVGGPGDVHYVLFHAVCCSVGETGDRQRSILRVPCAHTIQGSQVFLASWT